MKLKLVVALTAILLASVVRADSFTDGNGTIYYPDGSTITSYNYYPSTAENGYMGSSIIGFQFSDGIGVAYNYLPNEDEEFGAIWFNSPFSDLQVSWIGDIYINFVGPNGEIGSDMNFVPGPVSSISWDTDSTYSGSAGITSLTDPPPPAVPEPSALLLSGLGITLLCLFGKLKLRT